METLSLPMCNHVCTLCTTYSDLQNDRGSRKVKMKLPYSSTKRVLRSPYIIRWQLIFGIIWMLIYKVLIKIEESKKETGIGEFSVCGIFERTLLYVNRKFYFLYMKK